MHAIILRMQRVKDNDAIVDWLLDDDSIVSTYAAHIQGTQAYPNGLELMHVYEVEIVPRPNQDTARLRAAQGVERFSHIADALDAYACASCALETISNVCPKDSAVEGLFANLLAAFAVMDTAPELSTTLLAWIECFVLAHVGALPNLDMCVQCARPLDKSEWFEQEHGFVCPACARNQANVPAFVLDALRRLRLQTVRTTVQNALEKNRDEMQRRRILTPVLRLLAAVANDNSPFRQKKAHRFMAETVLHATDFC